MTLEKGAKVKRAAEEIKKKLEEGYQLAEEE